MVESGEGGSVEFEPQETESPAAPGRSARVPRGGMLTVLVVLFVAFAATLLGGILETREKNIEWSSVPIDLGKLLLFAIITYLFFTRVLRSLREAVGSLTTPEYGAIFCLVLALLFVYVVANPIKETADGIFLDSFSALKPLAMTFIARPAEIVHDGLGKVPWKWVTGALFIVLIVGTIVRSMLPRRER